MWFWASNLTSLGLIYKMGRKISPSSCDCSEEQMRKDTAWHSDGHEQMVGEGVGTRNGSLGIQGITSFPRSTSPLTTEEEGQYRVPYFKLPISLGEELQLRGDGGNTGGCAPGCQAEPPPANKATLSKAASLTLSLAQREPKDMIPSCLWPLLKLSQT